MRKVITLCGSTKFKAEFLQMQRVLTMMNMIVLSVGLFGHADQIELTVKEKTMLDDMHKEKIDMSSAIFVIDVDGYIGESTSYEIAYAKAYGKKVYYLSKFMEAYVDTEDGENN